MTRTLLAILALAAVVQAYTTVGGALGDNVTYAAGTYLFSSRVTSVNYNITFDCSGGSIYCKGKPSVGFFAITGSGDFKVINSTRTNRVYFTSSDDNTVGDTIVGSDGTPATGDYASVLNAAGQGIAIELYHVTVRYQGGPIGICLSNTTSNATSTITADDVAFYNCRISGNTYVGSFLGRAANESPMGAVSIRRLYIDSTCSLQDTLWAYGVNIYKPSSLSLTDSYISVRGGAAGVTEAGKCCFWVSGGNGLSSTIQNCYFEGGTKSACMEVKSEIDGVARYYVNNCVVVQRTDGSVSDGFSAHARNGVTNICHVSWNNCIAVNTSGSTTDTGFYQYETDGATVSCTTYACGAYGWPGNSNADVNTGFISADPSFGALATGANIITDSCVFPAGFAVTSASYIKHGSKTVAGAGLDFRRHSVTGYQYMPSDTVTPGIYYELSSFPVVLARISPDSADTLGGDTISIYGTGFGGTDGGASAYMGDSAFTISSWFDTLIVAVSKPFTVDTVDVVVTNAVSSSDTLANALRLFGVVAPVTPTNSANLHKRANLRWVGWPNWSRRKQRY